MTVRTAVFPRGDSAEWMETSQQLRRHRGDYLLPGAFAACFAAVAIPLFLRERGMGGTSYR